MIRSDQEGKGPRGGRKPVRRGLNIASDDECLKRRLHGTGEDGGFKSLVIMFGEKKKEHLPGVGNFMGGSGSQNRDFF